jgi:pyrimidine oxygenase
LARPQRPVQALDALAGVSDDLGGVLQATSRIGVFATVHMTVYPPSIIAKMMTTLDQIGPGRVGLNLVTGASYLDLAHVGLWRGD